MYNTRVEDMGTWNNQCWETRRRLEMPRFHTADRQHTLRILTEYCTLLTFGHSPIDHPAHAGSRSEVGPCNEQPV